MKELLTMWTNKRMRNLVLFTALIYASLQMTFQGFVLNPANVVPILTGLFFGPAGAFGVAFGSLLGDFFGNLGPSSIFSGLGNFLMAYIPYKLWNKLGIVGDQEPGFKKKDREKNLLNFIPLALISSLASAMVMAWGLDLLGLADYASADVGLALGNLGMSLVLGPLLFLILGPVVWRRKALWTQLMDVKKASPRALLGGRLMAAAAVVGYVAAMTASRTGLEQLVPFIGGAALVLICLGGWLEG